MSERVRLIRNHAQVIFARVNQSPIVILDALAAEGAGIGRIPVSEEERQSYYKRAEEELVAEGKIKPA